MGEFILAIAVEPMLNTGQRRRGRLNVYSSDVSARLHRLIWLLRAKDVETKVRWFARAADAKFDPNQPRVPAGNPDGGQWTDAGGSDFGSGSTDGDPSSYHIVQLRESGSNLIRVGTTLVPGMSVDRFDKTGDPVVDKMTEILLNRAGLAHVVAGQGAGPLYGTKVHTEFATDLRSQNIPGVEVEQSFSSGDVRKYGLDGTIRTDVILRDANAKVIAIWDLKTGTARLEPKRAQEIRGKVNVGPEVPIIELHIQRGVTNKRQLVQKDSSADETFVTSAQHNRPLLS